MLVFPHIIRTNKPTSKSTSCTDTPLFVTWICGLDTSQQSPFEINALNNKATNNKTTNWTTQTCHHKPRRFPRRVFYSRGVQHSKRREHASASRGKCVNKGKRLVYTQPNNRATKHNQPKEGSTVGDRVDEDFKGNKARGLCQRTSESLVFNIVFKSRYDGSPNASPSCVKHKRLKVT